MPIKQVFESAPGVYRTGLRTGIIEDPWADTPERDRIYDEYLWPSISWGGAFIIENPESPTDYQIAFVAINFERSTGIGEAANVVTMLWSGLTGEFLGHDTRLGIGVFKFQTGANGTIRGTRFWIVPDSVVYKLNPITYELTETHPYGFYEGSAQIASIPCVDEQEDIALFIGFSDVHSLGEVAVHRESTGEFLYKLKVCGIPESIFMAEKPHAYVVATDGTLTLFNYVTGQVLGVLHAGLTDNLRYWTWDRVAKRILCFEITPDILPEGHCTSKFRGYYPISLAHGLAGPIPLQAPRIGRRVEMLTKVYGAAGDGIPGQVVNYSLETPTGTVVAPIQHTTDLNGNSRTYVTASLAGDNTLTASTVV